MRAAIVLGAAAITLVAWIARADDAPPRRAHAVGFDHAAHAAAAPDIACTRCHALASGRIARPPSHQTCFQGCHTGVAARTRLREPIATDQLALCNPCHAETALVPRERTPVASWRKALAVEHDHTVDRAIRLRHDRHAQIACARCHTAGKPRRGVRAHTRCIGCHGDRKGTDTFAIGECERCHPPSTDKTRLDRPHLARGDGTIYVRSTFSHDKHATRGVAGTCETCHAAIASAAVDSLPRPTVKTCTIGGCHDGKAAFGDTASCTRCHRDVPTGKFEVWRPAKQYSHAVHDASWKTSTTKPACASCHPLSKSGQIEIAGHAACATADCHADDFELRRPKICNACHEGTEPWRPLVADRLPSDTSEFGANLDHRKHAGDCGTCHSLTTTRTQLRPPRGHGACATEGCHAVTGGPDPQLTACERCHVRGLAERREQARRTAPWSVRTTFVHAPHLATGAPCTQCHTDLSAPSVLELATPAKATCATAKCHDGTVAFKVTGTSCTRCHPGAKSR